MTENDDLIHHSDDSRLKFALEGSGDGIWDYNFITKKNIASRRMKEILGFDMQQPDADFYLDDWSERLHPDSQDETMKALQKVLDNETDVYTLEQKIRCNDGSYKWLLTRGKVVSRSEDGKPIRMIGTASDLSERKKSEEELKIYQFVMENAPITVLFLDASGCICYANKAGCEGLGYTKEALLKKRIPDISPSFLVRRWDDYWQNLKDNKTVSTETTHMRMNGELFPVEVVANYIEFGDKAYNIAFIKDISERKKAEKDLFNSEKELRRIFDNLDDTYYRTDIEGRLTMVSPSVINLMGEYPLEILGNKLSDYCTEDNARELFLAAMQAQGGKVRGYEEEIRRQDGQIIWVSINAHFLFGEFGETIGVEGALRNISDRRKLEEQLWQAQKIEALGTLVGGVAHEFNNTLAGITGNLYLARQKALHIPDVVSKLDAIEKLAFRSADLIKNMLSFARKGIINKTSFDLPSFLKEIIRIHQISLPEKINLNIDIEPSPVLVHWDENLLQQVVLNLVNNARDALQNSSDPAITIRLSSVSPDDDFLERHSHIEPGLLACLSVSDNGIGINAKNLPHIFEPFYTSKGIGQGTGLGLSMVIGAVQSHHGCVEVESIEGKGSTFNVYLPQIKIEKLTSQSHPERALAHGAGETVLLADDEPHLLVIGRAILESLGYRVLTANDGLEAVDVFKTHKDEISLLITDIMMPRLDGSELAKLIKEVRPDVKVIFSTGYSKDGELIGNIDPNATIMHKPYNIDVLSEVIRNQLENIQ